MLVPVRLRLRREWRASDNHYLTVSFPQRSANARVFDSAFPAAALRQLSTERGAMQAKIETYSAQAGGWSSVTSVAKNSIRFSLIRHRSN